MKRPHSAKPTRNHHQNTHDDMVAFDQGGKHFVKLNKKHLNHLLSASNDLSRMLPKHIHQDKERLYYQTLQLKNSLNELTQENLRMKTKVAILQRQKERLSRPQEFYLKKGGRSSNVLGVNSNKNEKENGVVVNLKKIIRQTKEENENLKSQLIKLKRNMRYTKINELQTQKQTIYDENKQLSNKIQKLIRQVQNRVIQQDQMKEMQHNMKQLTLKLKQVTADNIKYEELLEDIQIKYKAINEKMFVCQKKWQRQMQVERRKNQQMKKLNERLNSQINHLTQKLQEEKKKVQNSKKMIRPVSSHPYKQSNTVRPQSSHHDKLSDSNINKITKNKEKQEALMQHDKLQRQLQQAKKLLTQSQNKLKITGKDEISKHNDSKEGSISFNLTKNQFTQILQINQKQEYRQDFQESCDKKQIKKVSQLPINERNKKEIKSKSKSQNKSQDKIMNEIRQILTYRMKYNRYPFSQLKADIEVSPLSLFAYSDLVNMLVGEPFFLTENYVQHFLKVCYNKNKIKLDDELQSKVLITNLRKVIDDFQLLDQQQQEANLYKIADFLTKNRDKILKQFDLAKNKNKTVSKDKLIQIMNKYKILSESQIDLAISYTSMHCDNLSSINYLDFLDKFYINDSHEIERSKDASPIKQHNQEDQLSFGEKEDLDDGELIGDDQLI